MNSSGAEYQGGARSGRRPGQSGTREAILDAASHQFAARGYTRASLRAIAREAGVDQKLIAHYYGSKQRLFVAAIGLPLNPAEVLPALLEGPRETLVDRLRELLVFVLGTAEVHRRLTGVVRAAAGEPEVARMMREFMAREVFGPAAKALGGDDATFRLNLVGSQIVGLVMARFVVAIEPLASAAPEVVADTIAPTLARYLVGPL
jgi:AcrR family transcriptional regulator